MRTSFLALIIVALWSCESSGSDQYKRPAAGGADEIMVVIDSVVWAGSVGEELRNILAAPMQGMPQDEPLFQLFQINPMKLNTTLKSANNMIFVTTLDRRSSQSEELQRMFSDESLKRIQRDSSFFQVTEDNQFARGQKTLFLFGADQKMLTRNIKNHPTQILNLFEKRAREITKGKIFRSRSQELEAKIKQDHGFEIKIPFGWDLAKNHPDFVWVRELAIDKEKNIFIYKRPYTGPDDFNDIVGLRDYVGELHLRDSQKPDLFIKRQDIIPVFTKRTTFSNKFAMEARGLWAVSDMTAGGPFLSYALVDEPNGMLYYIEGYVYNPGGKKKRLMREMDAILSTFKVPSETKK